MACVQYDESIYNTFVLRYSGAEFNIGFPFASGKPTPSSCATVGKRTFLRMTRGFSREKSYCCGLVAMSQPSTTSTSAGSRAQSRVYIFAAKKYTEVGKFAKEFSGEYTGVIKVVWCCLTQTKSRCLRFPKPRVPTLGRRMPLPICWIQSLHGCMTTVWVS